MPDCTITILNEEGLHARPAAQFVQLANRFSSEIWVRKDDEQANGKSIMGLMLLGAPQGSVINISAEGADAAEAIDQIKTLVENGFYVDLAR